MIESKYCRNCKCETKQETFRYFKHTDSVDDRFYWVCEECNRVVIPETEKEKLARIKKECDENIHVTLTPGFRHSFKRRLAEMITNLVTLRFFD